MNYTNYLLYKKASKLYTYVDPDADLSLGLLSLRNAPEEAVVRRYKDVFPEHTTKADIIKALENMDSTRPDWIYALDKPIPDRAHKGLRKFRATHKLVSFDPAKITKLKKILRNYFSGNPEEVDPNNFKPLKNINWSHREKGRWFANAPAYKILTEDGRIPPELLMEE